MADLQTLSLVLTGIGLIIALIYYTLTLRNTNRTRQADMLMRLHSEWGNKYHQDAAWTVLSLDFGDYSEFESKYGPITEGKEVHMELYRVGWFFNGLGMLLHKGFVDIDLIVELFGYMVIWLWEIIEPVIIAGRELYGQPKTLEWYEYLHKELIKYKEEHPEPKT
jgi:hypothetical protein